MPDATEDLLRSQMKAILKFGVTQRALADQLDVSESWLSRWLANKRDVPFRAIYVHEMDRFRSYVMAFKQTLEETQRAADAATAGERFQTPDRRRSKTHGKG